MRASEGDAPIVECLSGDPNTCRISSSCRLKSVLVDAFDALYASLDEHTLADLVEKPRALTQALIRAESVGSWARMHRHSFLPVASPQPGPCFAAPECARRHLPAEGDEEVRAARLTRVATYFECDGPLV